jgi:hypothetical protein
MHVSPSQLADVFRNMPTRELLARIESGDLVPEALSIANAVLQDRRARGEDTEPSRTATNLCAPTSKMPGTQTLWRVAFVAYLLFLGLCLAGTLADPPSNLNHSGPYAGMIGLIASFAAGFPLSLVVGSLLGTFALSGSAKWGAQGNVLVLSFWACAGFNVLFLWWLGRRTRSRSDGSGA